MDALRKHLVDSARRQLHSAGVRTILRLRPRRHDAAWSVTLTIAFQRWIQQNLRCERSFPLFWSRSRLGFTILLPADRVGANAHLATLLAATLVLPQTGVAVATTLRLAALALAASFVRLARRALLLGFFRRFLLLGVRRRTLHRHEPKHRLQRGILLLASLAVVVLDVFCLLLRYVDAISVVPFLAGVATSVKETSRQSFEP